MNKKIQDDFQDFMTSDGIKPPKELDELILNRMRRKLSPSISYVFSKLALIQGIVGLITLSLCPQFQVGFGADHSLISHMSEAFGPFGCMAICGAIFLGSGAIVSGALLSRPERNLIRKTKYLAYFLLSGVALVLFNLCGGELYFDIAVAWILGAIISSIIGLEASAQIKQRLSLMRM